LSALEIDRNDNIWKIGQKNFRKNEEIEKSVVAAYAIEHKLIRLNQE
jgi:hypothetical protein